MDERWARERKGPGSDGMGWVGMGVPGREMKVMAENMNFVVLLAISIIAVAKYPNRDSLREERFILAHSLRAQSIMVGSPGGRSVLELFLCSVHSDADPCAPRSSYSQDTCGIVMNIEQSPLSVWREECQLSLIG